MFNLIEKADSLLTTGSALKLHSMMEEMANLLRQANIAVTHESDRAWEHFFSLSTQQQQDICVRYEKVHDIVKDIGVQGIDYVNTVHSLWRIYKRFNWLLDSDLINTIKDTDVVEIYLKDNTQIYRNSNYFKCTSYSIPDLAFFPWTELFTHDDSATSELMNILENVFIKNSREVSKLNPYLAQEIFSPKKYKALLESRFLAPIRGRDSRVNEGILVVWNINILGQEQ